MIQVNSNKKHIIYKLENRVTGEIYGGLTDPKYGKNYLKCIKGRFNRHVCRARGEAKNWALCRSIRQYGREAFTLSLLDVNKTKLVGHQLELA